MNRCPICRCWLTFVGLSVSKDGWRRWDVCTLRSCGRYVASTVEGDMRFATTEPPTALFPRGA